MFCCIRARSVSCHSGSRLRASFQVHVTDGLQTLFSSQSWNQRRSAVTYACKGNVFRGRYEPISGSLFVPDGLHVSGAVCGTAAPGPGP